MLITEFAVLAVLFYTRTVMAGSPCPPFETIKPCYCTFTEDSQTIVICSGIENSTQLLTATIAMKSMIVDRFMLLNVFKARMEDLMEENEVEDTPEQGQRLPKNWLASLRVQQVEIQDASLSNCFLCDEPLSGQAEFLTSLVATRSSLEGHLCSVCNTKIKHVSTRELQRTPQLKHVDLSFNDIQVLSGYSFPSTLSQLKRIVLSNNKISKIYDNAFANLNQLNELDLSNNHLTVVSRKMFRPNDRSLRSLDLSWNSIQVLPESMFSNLTSLKEIRLGNNLLEVLPWAAFSRTPTLLEKVDVKGNFLVCNCSMSWIKKMSKSTKLSGKCVAPTEVLFQDVKSTLTTIQACRDE